MNILVLAPQPFFQDRGTPLAVRMLAHVLGASGHRVDLLVYHEGRDVEIPNVRLLRTCALPGVRDIRPGPSFKKVLCDAAMLASTARLVASNAYDLVHAVEEAVFIALAVRQITGVPYVYDMDSSLSEQTAAKWNLPRALSAPIVAMERLAVRKSAGVIAVCKSLERKARAFDPAKPILRLEDVSLLEASRSVPDLRRTHGISGPIVMYVGNLEKYQGIDLLLSSFTQAHETARNARLIVIGGADSDIDRYRRAAKELKIDDAALFLGPRPVGDLGGYLAQADVLVSPRSQGDNTPMKIYSYLASGRAVLATRLPTHTQVLDDDVAVLEKPHPQAMARGLVRLLQDAELRRRIGTAAQQRAAREFSPEAFRRKLTEFYSRIAADLTPAAPAAAGGSTPR